MTEGGRVLIADDEETFLFSTVDLLRREGYECEGVMAAKGVLEMLSSKEYDLLVSDIRMPGNFELELIKRVPEIVQGLPVIIVTAYPSVETAVNSIHLRVLAYLVKPLDFDEFLKYVRTGVESSQLNRLFLKARQRLQDWNQNVAAIEEMKSLVPRNGPPLPINYFLKLSYQNITDTLSDIISLTNASGIEREAQAICHLRECPRLNALRRTLVHAIVVLEKTKSAFKSKDLGDLRKQIEETLNETEAAKPGLNSTD